MNRFIQQAGVGLAVLSLAAATGCGRDDGGDDASRASVGVSKEPCPQAVNKDKGCIYLGTISDLTGNFKALGVPITAGAKGFWDRVNEAGGIGDYEVDASTYSRDNGYEVSRHVSAYAEIRNKVLAMSQSLGSPTTGAIIKDLKADGMVFAPASLSSSWLFEPLALETGASYCAEAMNLVDHAVDELQAKSVMAVHYPGDYGGDSAAGARIAAEARDVSFEDVSTTPGADNQAGAIAAIVNKKPDVVVIATGPTEMATIVGRVSASGYQGKFLGSAPSFHPGVLESPAAPAILAQYEQGSSYPSLLSGSAGAKAALASVGSGAKDSYYLFGWASQYGLKAALEKAVESDDLTRAGLLAAARTLSSIDTEGILGEESGNYAATDGNDAAVRETVLNKPDKGSAVGTTERVGFAVGPTAADYTFTRPCHTLK